MQPNSLNALSRAIEAAVDVAVYPLVLALVVGVLWLVIDVGRRRIRDRLDADRLLRSPTRGRRHEGDRLPA
jgi:hypothetical protein